MTRALATLVAHAMRRVLGLLLGLGLVLGAFQFLLTQVAGYLLRTQAFGMLSSIVPEYLRSAAGPSMVVFLSFSGVVAAGYFHPVVIAATIGLAIAVGTEPAREVEARLVDLTLARAVARHAVISSAVLVLVATTAVLLVFMVSGTWLGLACCTPADAPRPAPRTIANLAVNLGLLAWCWGGIAIAAGAVARRRAVASGIAGVGALAAFLVDYLGRVWTPARFTSRFSPFHYFEPMPLVSGVAPHTTNLAVLAAVGFAGVLVGYVAFSRRDL